MPTKKSQTPHNAYLEVAINKLRKYRLDKNKSKETRKDQPTTANAKLYIPSQDLALITVEFLEICINSCNQNKNSLEEAYDIIKKRTGLFVEAAGFVLKDDAGISKFIIKNASLRVLKLIKDIIERNNHGVDEGSYEVYFNKTVANYQNFFGEAIQKVSVAKTEDQLGSGSGSSSNSSKLKILKNSYLDLNNEIDGLKEDIEETLVTIENKALEQIEGGDVILTVGFCNTLLAIFKRASEKYQSDPIHIVVCQGPNNSGERMARALKNEACDVSFITDSSMYVALQQGVNKVILGSKLILGDGSCVVSSGTHTLAAICAKQRNLPVIIAAGTHKFSTIFPNDCQTMHGNLVNTLSHIKLENKKHSDSNVTLQYPEVQDIIDPKSDIINNDCVDLLLVNDVAHTPGFVYRKLNEMYPLEEIHNLEGSSKF